ncbi:thioredoxin [Rhodococcus wratislaviensis IFP 2016]|nr:thioredoxin [Rhodococcus wratislaviensis IFP 2016]
MGSDKVKCPNCGKINKVPAAGEGKPRCGNCHEPLPRIARIAPNRSERSPVRTPNSLSSRTAGGQYLDDGSIWTDCQCPWAGPPSTRSGIFVTQNYLLPEDRCSLQTSKCWLRRRRVRWCNGRWRAQG